MFRLFLLVSVCFLLVVGASGSSSLPPDDPQLFAPPPHITKGMTKDQIERILPKQTSYVHFGGCSFHTYVYQLKASR